MAMEADRPHPALDRSNAGAGGSEAGQERIVGARSRPTSRNTCRLIPGLPVRWNLMTYHFRQAMCNEAFDKWPFADACDTLRKAGYEGIEIAPFTLAEDPATITAGQRREYSNMMDSTGLKFVGLHWLMVSPKGLHVTTPDTA